MFKFKRSQTGFAATETILILVIVGLVAFVAWYAFNTKSNTDSTLDNAAANTAVVPSKTQNTEKSAKSEPTQITVTKTDSKLGQYLAAGNDKALYTYGADTTGASNCTGSCLTAWPIYDASNAPASLPANVTVIKRSDGKSQYAYKGMPLYYYTGDTTAGMVTGDGVNNFHIAKP